MNICLHMQAALAQAEDRVRLTEGHLRQHLEATHKLQGKMEHLQADVKQAHEDLRAAQAQVAEVGHVHCGLCSTRPAESWQHCCATLQFAVDVDMLPLTH